MKKSLLSTLIMLLFSVMSFAQGAGDWRIHPDDAEYKIYGHFETTFTNNGNVSYELTEVKPVGLSFPVQKKYFGGHTTGGNVFFTFDHVKYQGNPDFDNIALWTYDDVLGKWVADVETGKEEGAATNTNEMTVMLVLDCSASLGSNGLEDVKSSAKSFIDVMLKGSQSGNIHIGIIGFSSMQKTKTLPMQPLTGYSAEDMKSFIDSFEQGNGTALYKSFDAAVDITQEYVKRLDKFAGSAIVTFTDGLDNGSNNFEKRIGSKQAYFKYIQDEVLNQSIGGFPYQSYTIFVPGGSDVKDNAVKDKIVRELKIIAKEEGRYFTVNNTAELDRQFKSIAKSLIDSWKVLSCFISAGQNGKVCWTFGKKYVQPVVEKSDAPLLLGLNGGLGIPMEFGECLGAGLDFHLGFDFAYPLTDRFALGAYLSVGGGFTAGEYYSYYSNYYDYYFGGVFKFSAGLLMEFGDLNDRPFMLGISPCAGFEFTYGTYTVPIELRFGRVLANDWYMMGELVMGFGYGTYLEPAIRVGYNFGNNVYPRKKR